MNLSIVNSQSSIPPEAPLPRRYRIVSGEPTWEGQPLDVCEEQINTWGLQAFLREAQHEIQQVGGYFFNADRFEIVEVAPKLDRVCLAWDLAATEGGGDHTVCVWLGMTETGIAYVLHVVRGQWSSEKVSKMVVEHAEKAHRLFSNYTIRIPQDPGQAGKSQADAVRRALAPYKRVRVVPISGPKAARARGWAEKVNVGNVKLLKAAWNDDFIREHSKFREDGNHLCDDQVDAASDAFNELATPGTGRVVAQGIRPNPLYKRDA